MAPAAVWRCETSTIRGCDRMLPVLEFATAVDDGDRQGENAAGTQFTLHCDGSAQQRRQISRYRQPQSGAAERAMNAAVSLTDGFEEHVLMIRRDADAGIPHRKRQRPVLANRNAQSDFTLFREFKRIGINEFFSRFGRGAGYRCRCARERRAQAPWGSACASAPPWVGRFSARNRRWLRWSHFRSKYRPYRLRCAKDPARH